MTSSGSDPEAQPPSDVAVWMPAGFASEGDLPVAERPTPDAWRVDPSAAPTAHTEFAVPRRREPRRWIVLAVGLLAVAAAGVTVYGLREDDTQAPNERRETLDGSGQAPTSSPADRVRDALGELAGIPQVGSILGSDRELPTLTVFADISSRDYARFDDQVLPALLAFYVRTGRVRIQLRTLSGETAISRDTARIAQAAGLQTRFWQFVRALSGSNRGRIDADDVAAAERAVAGLDRDRLAADSRSTRVQDAIARASRMAPVGQARSGPAFTITDGDRMVGFTAPLSSPGFSAALRKALERLGAAPNPSGN